jgi:hypothetical protein
MPGDGGQRNTRSPAGAWAARVEAAFGACDHPQSFVLAPHAAMGRSTIDWIALPARVVGCLGRERALALLDWRGRFGDEGRRRVQEEYLEWRCIRDTDGRMARIEFTTEFAERWETLAATDPDRLCERVAELADEPQASVPASEIFGDARPGTATPDELARGFQTTMVAGRSPYNAGPKAICCMVQPTNTLEAMVALAAAASACPAVKSRGHHRAMTCSEAIPILGGAAKDGRASDPLLVERIGRLAFEHRQVAFDDPVGTYIGGVEHGRLRTPDGESVPIEWFTFSTAEGATVDPTDSLARPQRLVLEIPPGERMSLSDLSDVATEESLRFGGQVAELVQVVLALRAGPAGMVEPTAGGERLIRLDGGGASSAPQDGACNDIETHLAEFEASR